MQKQEISICWLRRDLRLFDNAALYHALKSPFPVLLVFIFDKNILDKLDDKSDKRVAFIHETLSDMNDAIQKFGSSMLVIHDTPLKAFASIEELYQIKEIFINRDYEPSAIERDIQIKEFAKQHQISFNTFKDQVIFEKSEVMKADQSPYTIFTPYSKIWKQKYNGSEHVSYLSENLLSNLLQTGTFAFPSLKEISFKEINSTVATPKIDEDLIRHYAETRNTPGIKWYIVFRHSLTIWNC